MKIIKAGYHLKTAYDEYTSFKKNNISATQQSSSIICSHRLRSASTSSQCDIKLYTPYCERCTVSSPVFLATVIFFDIPTFSKVLSQLSSLIREFIFIKAAKTIIQSHQIAHNENSAVIWPQQVHQMNYLPNNLK